MSNTVLGTEEITRLKNELAIAIEKEKSITAEMQGIRKTNYESNDSDVVMKNDIIMKNKNRDLHSARITIERITEKLSAEEK